MYYDRSLGIISRNLMILKHPLRGQLHLKSGMNSKVINMRNVKHMYGKKHF